MDRFRLATPLLVAAGAYLLYLGGMVALQDQLIFPIPGGVGTDQLDAAAAEGGAEPFRVTTEDGLSLYGWHRRASGDRAILYLHGNGETVAGNVALQRLVTQHGWDFLTIAYRGYPGSEGKPSEQGLRLDARALWTHATESVGIPADHLVIYGRSLGGGVAVQLAAETNPRGMVLESTFFSLLELAQKRAVGLPVRWLLRHRFESWRYAPRAGVPVLQLHSRDDQVIPVDHARRLHTRFAESEYLEAEGLGHNQPLPVFDAASKEALLAFLQRMVPDG